MYIHNMFVVHIRAYMLFEEWIYMYVCMRSVHMYVHVRRGKAFREVQLKYGTCMWSLSIVDTTGLGQESVSSLERCPYFRG